MSISEYVINMLYCNYVWLPKNANSNTNLVIYISRLYSVQRTLSFFLFYYLKGFLHNSCSMYSTLPHWYLNMQQNNFLLHHKRKKSCNILLGNVLERHMIVSPFGIKSSMTVIQEKLANDWAYQQFPALRKPKPQKTIKTLELITWHQ